MERQSIEEGSGEAFLEAKPQTEGTTGALRGTASEPPSNSSNRVVVVFSVLVAAGGFFCYGIAAGYSSPAEAGIREDLGLSVAAFAVFGSIMQIGGMVGALLSGKITDIFGRRKAVWFAEIYCIIGWLAIAFAKEALWLDFGRLSIGFGVSIIAFVVPVYIAEIVVKDLRGFYTAFAPNHIATSQQQSEARFFYLFQRKYANTLIIVLGLMLLQQLQGTSALSFYASSIFEAAGFSTTIGTTTTAILLIPSVTIAVSLMDKAGRKPLLLTSGAGLAFSFFLLGFAFCFQGVEQMKKVTAILALIGALFSGLVHMALIYSIYVFARTRVFHQGLSWKPGNFRQPLGRLACRLFNFMLEWSSGGTFFIFVVIDICTILFVAKIVPETKGRTLEEIQDSISSTSFLR